MSRLNVMCGICNEYYAPNDVIYTTSCGHVFHHQCLMRWLSRSLSCPQCRANCHRRRVHRVFLNFAERNTDEDILQPVNDPIQWIPLDLFGNGIPGPLPAGAIKAGTDPDGNDAYVARVYHEDDLLPANYVPQKRGVYTPWNCRTHFLVQDVEILVDCDYKWVSAIAGQVPPDAIPTGYSETGENLYTGRAEFRGITLPGKLHPSHGVLYMPFEGEEVNSRQYEVLVLVPKDHADR